MTATTTTFPARIAAARKAVTVSRGELAAALRHVQPMSAEMHELFITRNPAGYAECLRKVADIMVTIPDLRTAAEQAEQALAPLDEQACWKCHGTGQYSGPTSALRRGVPYCFDCNGAGTR